ncbi:unnamed protein product [Effrenium voratum]|uniref:Ion transport domain-containing protein n=1 Tax=Effrenium voratum TaxID=2562239 RepID=A0AA36IZ46_9DINO|nr:unnamed protein product [Effrenium voratum]
MLPALPEKDNGVPKKQVNAQTDGLELCKQAVALLVGDIRAEIQQAVGLLKGEAHNATAMRNPIAAKLLLVADSLQHAEKDALGKLRELLTHSNWELGQRLDQQMQVNAALGDHMHSSRELTIDVVTRIEQSMKRLEANMGRETTELRSEMSKVKEVVFGLSSQVDRESQTVQRQNLQQTTGLESRLMQQLGLVRSDFEEQVRTSSSQVVTAMRQLEDQASQCNEGISSIITTENYLKSIAEKIKSEIFRMQQQDDKHYVDLGHTLDAKIANQDEHILSLVSQTEFCGSLPQDVSRLRKKVGEDIRIVLSEIARVQKALQVDYLPPSSTATRLRSTTRKLSDASRMPRDEDDSQTFRRPPSAVAVTFVEQGTGSAGSAALGHVRSEGGHGPEMSRTETGGHRKHHRLSRPKDLSRGATQRLSVSDEPSSPREIREPDSPEEPLAADALFVEKRYRDIAVQMDTSFKDCSVQTDASWNDLAAEKAKRDKKKKKAAASKEESVKQHTARAANLTPMDKLKEKATAAAMKKQYNVMDFYKDEGCAQRIARHPFFDNLTIMIVILNSIWLGVDADLNKEALLWNAHPVFIVGENFFCLYFTVEIIIRFIAFQRKINAFKNFWFSFDLFLALLIIVETWITPTLLLLAGGSAALPENTGLLRLIRLARLVRLTRLTRLLRSFPELMIIVKGLAFAARSVCVFSLLWAIITYAFAILFRQLTEGSAIGTSFFSSVPESINTLLLPAVFGANAEVINSITAGNPGLWPLMVFFMALVSVTIMYMLLGVLVDVIGAVASTEKQKIEISYIVGQLRDELDKMAIVPEDLTLNQADFQKLVLEPGIVRVMADAGVNVDVLAEMLDLVWEDAAKTTNTMTWSDLVNMVLNMRGSNPATVKDCKEQIRVTNSLIKRCFGELFDELDEALLHESQGRSERAQQHDLGPCFITNCIAGSSKHSTNGCRQAFNF